MHPSRTLRKKLRRTYAILSLVSLVSLQLTLVAAKCPTPNGALSDFIDPATLPQFCKKAVCVGSYTECCGSDPNSCTATGSTEQLELVFSDEFEGYSSTVGELGSPGDIRWTSMDYHYSSDKNEWQNYKPEQVTVEGGRLLLTMEDKNSTAVRYGAAGPDSVFANKTSGMVQSWNKFCFTGGYVEFNVRLPGKSSESGFWAATWLMGNLGRAGHYPSLEGMWPFSYDGCANGDGAHSWNDNKTQRISRCSAPKGRGAPEIDVLEYGKLGGPPGRPTYVHTMQMGPVIPPFTSWIEADGRSGQGISLPGQATTYDTQLPNYRGQLSRDGFPRTGSSITDTYTGSSYLDGDPSTTDSYFNSHHTYGLLWEPGEYVRWYLDDILLFEVDKVALRAQSAGGLTVEERLIPKEPSYLIMNLAMSNNAWAKVDKNLTYPGVMSVEHVRIWQRPGRVSVGCDTRDYPTSQYISCNRDLYMPQSEQASWQFEYCAEFRNVENQFLLGLGVSCAAVLAVATVLMLCMRRAFQQERQLQDQVGRNLPEGITAAQIAQGKLQGCYINKGGPELQEVLRHTRPDLIAAAEAAVAETKAKN